jgi:hypothetical protein
VRYFIPEDAFIVAEVVAAPTIYDAFYDEPFYRAEYLARSDAEGMLSWDRRHVPRLPGTGIARSGPGQAAVRYLATPRP